MHDYLKWRGANKHARFFQRPPYNHSKCFIITDFSLAITNLSILEIVRNFIQQKKKEKKVCTLIREVNLKLAVDKAVLVVANVAK